MTSDASGNVRILGTLGSTGGTGVVRVEDRFDTDIEDLWSAVTDPARLERWLGKVEGDLRVGGEFHAWFYASGWEGRGRVEACERPNRLLVLTKDIDEPDEQPPSHAIEVTLSQAGDQTIFAWEERGMPIEHLAAYRGGIQIHVEDLADYIAGRARRDDAAARWKEIQAGYEELADKVS